MIDGRKKQDETSEDDWAMSEPDPSLKGEDLEIESPVEDVNENVSSLYDPLHTDELELEGWDLSSEDTAPSASESSFDELPPEVSQSQSEVPEIYESSQGYQAPHNTFEIIEPEKPPVMQENWEMKASSPQGNWQMPEPQFRCSEGMPLQKNENFLVQAATSQSMPQEVEETLSGIYSPPDTEEGFDEEIEEVELSTLEEESFETEDFSETPEAETGFAELSVESTNETLPKKSKSKTFVFVLVGFLLTSVVILGLLGAAYFFYFK